MKRLIDSKILFLLAKVFVHLCLGVNSAKVSNFGLFVWDENDDIVDVVPVQAIVEKRAQDEDGGLNAIGDHAYLFKPESLDGCHKEAITDPSAFRSKDTKFFSASKGNLYPKNLLLVNSANCDIWTKVRNGAESGFDGILIHNLKASQNPSSIIVGADELKVESHPNFKTYFVGAYHGQVLRIAYAFPNDKWFSITISPNEALRKLSTDEPGFGYQEEPLDQKPSFMDFVRQFVEGQFYIPESIGLILEGVLYSTQIAIYTLCVLTVAALVTTFLLLITNGILLVISWNHLLILRIYYRILIILRSPAVDEAGEISEPLAMLQRWFNISSRISAGEFSRLRRIYPTAEEVPKYDKCSICLGEVCEGQVLVNLRCDHIFHEPCIRELILVHHGRTCPYCRGEIIGPEYN